MPLDNSVPIKVRRGGTDRSDSCPGYSRSRISNTNGYNFSVNGQ